MLIQNVVLLKRYVSHLSFKGERMTVTFYGGRSDVFVLPMAPTDSEIKQYEQELEDRTTPTVTIEEGKYNLYVKIGNDVVRGRIIESVYFKTQSPTVVVKYLCGSTKIVKLSNSLSTEDINTIFTEICNIQAAPCYPYAASNECACLLDMITM